MPFPIFCHPSPDRILSLGFPGGEAMNKELEILL